MAIKKIVFLTKYGEMAASSRLRAYQYKLNVDKSICSIDVQSLLDDKYLNRKFDGGAVRLGHFFWLFLKRLSFLFKIIKYDIAIIHIDLFPYLPPIIERLLFYLSVKVYFDYDDAVFHHYEYSDNALIRFVLSGKIRFLMKHADGVICCNKYIQNYALDSGAIKTVILPTVVNVNDYSCRFDYKLNNKVFVVGWIGSPSTYKYVGMIFEALERIASVCPVTLYLVGAGAMTNVPAKNVKVISMPWSIDNEKTALSVMDVGVMPLFGSRWDKGKCAFKLILYMASSLPVVASGVGMNSDLVTDENGFIANNSEEWFDALYRLYCDETLRKALGTNGRRLIEGKYTINANLTKFIDFLEL